MNLVKVFAGVSIFLPLLTVGGCSMTTDEELVGSVAQSQSNYSARKRCTGSTVSGKTAWQQYKSDSLYVDVSVTSCGLGILPVYFASLSGTTGHARTLGSTSIYQATESGFRIYIKDLAGPVTPADANARGWRINWEAISLRTYSPQAGFGGAGSGTAAVWIRPDVECVGQTESGNTEWQQYNQNGIYVDVDMSSCGFTATPNIITSLGGTSSHWTAKGVSSIYAATPTGFRIYLYQSGLTPAVANARHWAVNWRASPQNSDALFLCTGVTSNSDWEQDPNDPTDIYQDIDISECSLDSNPVIHTSLAGQSAHWTTNGVTSIYDETSSGFRIHVRRESVATSPAFAANNDWRINWTVATHY